MLVSSSFGMPWRPQRGYTFGNFRTNRQVARARATVIRYVSGARPYGMHTLAVFGFARRFGRYRPDLSAVFIAPDAARAVVAFGPGRDQRDALGQLSNTIKRQLAVIGDEHHAALGRERPSEVAAVRVVERLAAIDEAELQVKLGRLDGCRALIVRVPFLVKTR